LEFHLVANATIEELKYQEFSTLLAAGKYEYTTLLISIAVKEQYVNSLSIQQHLEEFHSKSYHDVISVSDVWFGK